MVKLINADLYKSFHRMYLFIFMAFMAAASIFVNAILAYAHLPLEASVQLILGFLMVPLFLISMFADIVTAEENKEHTLKNTISFGIPRYKLYLAKNISTILVALNVALVTLIAYLASAFLLLKPENNNVSDLLTNFALRIAVALLVYIAAATLATLLATLIKRNSLFTFAYFGLLIVPVVACKLLGLINPFFSRVQNVMLYTQTQIIANVPQAQLMNPVWITLAHIAVFVGLGIVLFKRQEIN